MSDTKNNITEDAACGSVGGGAIASVAMPLLAQANKRPIYKVPAKKTKKVKKKTYGIREALRSVLFEADMDFGMDGDPAKKAAPGFDSEGVISKLKAAEKKDSVDRRNTQQFGLEDENGKIVRVTVPNDQADSFEGALQAIVTRSDDMQSAEIAEILFALKDQFTFIDVEWPEIEEDEEIIDPDTVTDAAPETAGVEGNDLNDLSLDEPSAESTDTSTEVDEVKGLLTKVIDMMKSDADARRQEAVAREKEAEVRAADSAVNQALAKVKQEEQILDMEVWNKAQKEESKEAKRLAQLARWKHEMSKNNGDLDDEEEPLDDILPGFDDSAEKAPRSASSEENEESTTRKKSSKTTSNNSRKKTIRSRVKPADVASYILRKLR